MFGDRRPRKPSELESKTSHSARFGAPNARRTIARQIPESVANLFVRIICHCRRYFHVMLAENNYQYSAERQRFTGSRFWGLLWCLLSPPSSDPHPHPTPHPQKFTKFSPFVLAHQNRTIAIASDFRVDEAKSPEIPQKEGVLGSEITARNRKSLATFHRTLKSQCSIAFSCFGNRAISGVRDGHRNRKSQKSLRFRCAKPFVSFLRGHL